MRQLMTILTPSDRLPTSGDALPPHSPTGVKRLTTSP